MHKNHDERIHAFTLQGIWLSAIYENIPIFRIDIPKMVDQELVILITIPGDASSTTIASPKEIINLGHEQTCDCHRETQRPSPLTLLRHRGLLRHHKAGVL